MTHLTSLSLPSGPHIPPESRITTGIEASMMMSLPAFRLVIPLAESTMARAGRVRNWAWRSASMACRWSSGSQLSLARRSPRPRSGLTPSFLKAPACLANTSAKNTDTKWPNMTGSETFIMVALRCTEKRTSWRRASSICSAMKARRALMLMNEPSSTSPAFRGSFSLSTFTVPALSTNSMRAVTGCSRVRDRSLP